MKGIGEILPIILVLGLIAFGMQGQEGPHTFMDHWSNPDRPNYSIF